MSELDEIREKKLRELTNKYAATGMDTTIEVGDRDFDEKVLNQLKDTVTIVDFWSMGCIPCLTLGPILERLAKEYKGKFVLAKVNVDQNPVISARYGVNVIPTVMLFKNGEAVDGFVGSFPEDLIRQWIDKHLEQ